MIFFATQSLFAQEETKKNQILEEIVVTGTRTEEHAIDVPINTEVITRGKIEMSGMTHVGDLIGKYITGHYHKYNGMLSSPGMRGFYTEAHGVDIKGHVLILVDGHRTGTGNAAKLGLDRIERIEITKGPSSALYGSAAMGGVINLITKKGDGDLTATIGGDVGSFDYFKTRISGGGKVNDKFRFFASTSYEDVDDYEIPDYDTAYNTGETKKNFGGNFVWTFNPDHELRLGGNYAANDGEAPEWIDDAYSGYYDGANQYYTKSNGYGDLEYNGDFLDGKFHWRGMGYYIWDLNHWYYGTRSYGTTNPADYQSKMTDETLGTDHQLSWNMTEYNTLLLGFTVEHLEKENEGVSAGEVSIPSTPNTEVDSKAAFLQDSLDLWDNRINIIAAFRYDRFDVTTNPPTQVEMEDFTERDEDFSHFSPKLGIGVKFLDDLLRVRANMGQGFRAPSADELSMDYIHPSTGVHYLGNPELDPETTLTYEVGFDIFHDQFTLKTGYFHTDYEDKITRISSTVDGESFQNYVNKGDAEIAGIEVNFEWWISQTVQLPFELSLYSNIAISTTKDDKETGEDLQWISDYEVKSGLNLNHQGLRAQLSHTLVGPQMITNWDTYEIEEKQDFDYFDLSVSYDFLEHWQVRGSILNMFDNTVEWIRGYPMAERNYQLGLSYTFGF